MTGKIRDDLPDSIKKVMNAFRNDNFYIFDGLFEELDSGIADWRKLNIHSKLISRLARIYNIEPDKMMEELCERCEESKFDEVAKRYCIRHPSKYSKRDCLELPDEYKGCVHPTSTKSNEFRDSMKVDVNMYEDASSTRNQGTNDSIDKKPKYEPGTVEALMYEALGKERMEKIFGEEGSEHPSDGAR